MASGRQVGLDAGRINTTGSDGQCTRQESTVRLSHFALGGAAIACAGAAYALYHALEARNAVNALSHAVFGSSSAELAEQQQSRDQYDEESQPEQQQQLQLGAPPGQSQDDDDYLKALINKQLSDARVRKQNKDATQALFSTDMARPPMPGEGSQAVAAGHDSNARVTSINGNIVREDGMFDDDDDDGAVIGADGDT